VLEVLLHCPAVQLYLLTVALLVVACFWPRRAGPPRPGPAEDDPAPLDRQLPRSSGRQEPSAVQKLKADCAAEYDARFAEAIKQIRYW
jgi:hypothetical protein